jgi:hypothetical protein
MWGPLSESAVRIFYTEQSLFDQGCVYVAGQTFGILPDQTSLGGGIVDVFLSYVGAAPPSQNQ